MKINELQPRQGKIEIIATVLDVGQARTFDKGGSQGRVANVTIKDETGSIKLSLWNEQIDQVHVGDLIKITNGYASEFRGEMQLSTGKFGKLEVVNKQDALATSTDVDADASQPTYPSPTRSQGGVQHPSSGKNAGRFSEQEDNDGDDDEDSAREEESDFSIEEEDVT